MKSLSRIFLALVSMTVACSADTDRDALPVAVVDELELYDALAPASPTPEIASLYFTVVNTGSLPDTLLDVRTDAGTAMLHDVVMEDGLSRMLHVPTIEIAANDTLRLVPGSYHVMLSHLPRRIVLGDTIAVTLQFARAGEVTLNAPVLTYTEVVKRLDPEHMHQ